MVDAKKYTERRREAETAYELAKENLRATEDAFNHTRKAFNEAVLEESRAREAFELAVKNEHMALDDKLDETTDGDNDRAYDAARVEGARDE